MSQFTKEDVAFLRSEAESARKNHNPLIAEAFDFDDLADRIAQSLASPMTEQPSVAGEPESEFEKALDDALNMAHLDGLKDYSFTQSAATIEKKREVVRLYRAAVAEIERLEVEQ